MSILVELLSCFRDKPENIATRALYSVLKAESAFLGFSSFLEIRLGWDRKLLEIKIQQREGRNFQPDLAGIGADNSTVFFGEVKFWAGLTPNQPCNYLDALAPGGLLLFIAPKSRFQELWPKLTKSFGTEAVLPEGFDDRCLVEVRGRSLALVSGLEVLDALLESTRELDKGTHADLVQLRALWSEYDAEEFPILREEELAHRWLPNLFLGLAELPEKIAGAACRSSDTESFKDGAEVGQFFSLKCLRIGRMKGWVVYSPKNWKTYGLSPIWFETRKIYFASDDDWSAIYRSFSEHSKRNGPFSAKTSERWDAIAVPLRIEPNAIELDIVTHIVDQLRKLAERAFLPTLTHA